VAAARQPEVFAGDPDPLEVLRGSEHFLDQLTILGLDAGALGEGATSFGHTISETVSNGLDLAQVEHPWCSGDRLEAMGDLGVPEGLAEEAGQLRLKPGNLPAQLQPRLALVYRDVQPVESLFSQ
jgi:hypothetical protein